MRIRLNKKGFTLIELLIVVAIIGIIAAIAIPNLLNAIQRGKQKRSMADMRAIGTAVESYAVDNNFYPAGASAVAGLTSVLEPKYIRNMPVTDAWTQNIDYENGGASNPQDYTITSYGKDTTFDGSIFAGATTSFNNDIVFSGGTFVQFPEGSQE